MAASKPKSGTTIGMDKEAITKLVESLLDECELDLPANVIAQLERIEERLDALESQNKTHSTSAKVKKKKVVEEPEEIDDEDVIP